MFGPSTNLEGHPSLDPRPIPQGSHTLVNLKRKQQTNYVCTFDNLNGTPLSS